jgi:GNAT superfamily N-acetyltransferase
MGKEKSRLARAANFPKLLIPLERTEEMVMCMARAMTDVNRLERFWHDLALTFPETVRINEAVACHVLEIPAPFYNHVTSVNVDDDEAEDFLKTVIKHFSSRKLPFACFRVSPLTRPTSFASLLGLYGFEKSFEQSIMVFRGEPLEDKLNLDVKIREISEDEIDTFDKVVFSAFEMPIEWKKAGDRIFLEWMRRGAKNYVAYAEGKPVGTATLFSLMKTGGIFAVGTLKEYRRHGIATSLIVKALLDSVEQGNDLHTLQCVKGGDAERLYQRIGFEIDHTVAFFVNKF